LLFAGVIVLLLLVITLIIALFPVLMKIGETIGKSGLQEIITSAMIG